MTIPVLRTAVRAVRCATTCACFAIPLMLTATPVQSQNAQPTPKRALSAAAVKVLQDSARSAGMQLARREYDRASRQFSQVIEEAGGAVITPEVQRVLADAFFGRASAAQQGARPVLSDSAAVARWSARTFDDYLDAIALDSARLAPSAYNNMGILLRDAGDDRRALALFLSAARAAGNEARTRGAFWLHAAGMYDALGVRDSAAMAYRQALAADSSLGAARAALMDIMLSYEGADSAVSLANRWVTDSRASGVVEDAMYQVLSERRTGTGMPNSAYEILMRSFVARGLSPASMLRDEAPRLRPLASFDLLRAPIDSCLALAAARTPSQVFAIDPRDTRWWTPLPRAAMWGGMLRVFGDAHNAAGRTELARAFYESALGMPWRPMPPEYMDIESIVPLASIYAQLPDSTARIDRLIDGVFNGKGIAYAEQDKPRIRRFHMALGTFFASRDDWRSGPRGALFQLERMRRTTTEINRARPSAEPLRDPPELLDQLLRGYCLAGRTADATALMPEIIEGYRRIGAAIPSASRPCQPARSR